MKKIVFMLLTCCALSQQMTAQDFRFGVQASPTWSWIKTDEKLLEGAGSNWGLKLAMMGEKYFRPNYAFISGIGFGFNHGGFLQSNYYRYQPFTDSDLTVKLDQNDTMSLAANSKLHYRLRYVEVPFGFKMRGGSNEDSPIKYFAEMPVITLGFMTKAVGDINGSGKFDTQDENIRDDVRGLSMSWGCGGGIEYELATHTTLVAGIFYQSQFTDISQKARARRDNTAEWTDEKVKSSFRALTLRVGVFF